METAASNRQQKDFPEGDPAKNFGIDPQTFDDLVTDLRNGGDQLFQQIFLAHFEDCRSYLQRKNSLSYEVAYDLTMDTLLVFRHKLINGKIGYGNLRFLFTQMAHQQFLKQLRTSVSSRPLEEVAEVAAEDQEHQFDDEVKSAFQRSWKVLGDGCKDLLKQFYYEETTLEEIAHNLQKKAPSIRKRKQRCMEKLRLLFAERYTH